MITIVRKILCFSVEPEAQRKLTRHGSVEIYDGKFHLKVSSILIVHLKVVLQALTT